MNSFGKTVRRLRIEEGLSQQQLADYLHVSRSSVANWEVSRRIPDATMVALIADALDVDTGALLASSEATHEAPNVLLVDDKAIILEGGLPILRQPLPGANVIFLTGFQEYAFDAWDTGACGFLLKPLEVEDVCKQILRLGYPMRELM